MARLQRRTPCIGVCSTTYGDLVCRGCKRFAHEIVDWNRYTDSQQKEVEARLRGLKVAVIEHFLQLSDPADCAQQLGLEGVSSEELLLGTYHHLVGARPVGAADPLRRLPIRLLQGVESTAQLRSLVDGEFLARSKAAYERNFKVAVDW